jgi:hypothetical protein
MKKKIFDLNLQEEADKFRQNRDSAVDHERQLNMGLKEIEQVNSKKLHDLSINFDFVLVTNRIASSRGTCTTSML